MSSKPVVLIAEELSPATVDALGPDFEIRHCNGADRAELLPAIADVDAILSARPPRSTPRPSPPRSKLKVVARAGVGLDNVDVSAATKAGVMVVNAPTSNIVTAAELACGLLVATARNIPQANAALKNGEWKRSKYTGVELSEKTLGVVGLGRIGVAGRAADVRLRHEGRRLRPLRAARARRADGRQAAVARRAARGLRLHHRPPAQDPRDARPDRRRGAAQGQAERPHRQRRARRDRRRGGAVLGAQGGPRRRRRPRRVRQGAVHGLPAVRVRPGRLHPAPRRLHRRGPGEGRHRGRQVGAPRARRRAGPGRGERPGRRHRRGRQARVCRSPRSSAGSSPRSRARSRSASTSRCTARSPSTT